MSKKILDHSSVKRNYRFLAILLAWMVAGALLGWFKPAWGHNIAFLGKVFINMMFCIVVPLVFASTAGPSPGWRAATGPARSWEPPWPPSSSPAPSPPSSCSSL